MTNTLTLTAMLRAFNRVVLLVVLFISDGIPYFHDTAK